MITRGTAWGKRPAKMEKTYHQGPRSCKQGVVLPVDKHHPRDYPCVMLPSVAQLMPPFSLNHLALVDLINRPQVAVGLIQKNALEDMTVIRDWRSISIMVHAELMLVVCAVERHLNLLWVFCVGVRIVHGPITARFAFLAPCLIFGEFYLLFLVLGFGLRTQFGIEACFVLLLEIFGIRVGDGDVIKEPRSTKDKFLFPSCSLPKKFFGVICEDCHDQLVKRLGFRNRTGLLALAVVLFSVEWSCLEYDTLFGSTHYGRDIGAGANVDSFRSEICSPVRVKSLKVRKRNHRW